MMWTREPGDSWRWGNAKLATVRRDFSRLRDAIRAHNPEATEAAWEKCERWLEALPMPQEGGD